MFWFGWPRPAAVKAAASSVQVCPVSEEVQGSSGTHQASVAML